jgi:hypothetical protein
VLSLAASLDIDLGPSWSYHGMREILNALICDSY